MADLAERFWAKVEKRGPDECWEWTAARTGHGYGEIGEGSKRALAAHRVAYELTVGPIPEGLVIDHLCENKGCVNPAHMEVVAHRVNVLRSAKGAAAQNERKTHCKRGHPLSGANLRIHPNGSRQCRECQRMRKRGEV